MFGVPWGAVLAIVIIGLVGTIILSLAQVAMPQESQDKRLLWERFFEYRERCHTAASANKSRPRKAEQAAADHDATVAALAGSLTSSGGTAAHSP
jgi:hypothetical protein